MWEGSGLDKCNSNVPLPFFVIFCRLEAFWRHAPVVMLTKLFLNFNISLFICAFRITNALTNHTSAIDNQKIGKSSNRTPLLTLFTRTLWTNLFNITVAIFPCEHHWHEQQHTNLLAVSNSYRASRIPLLFLGLLPLPRLAANKSTTCYPQIDAHTHTFPYKRLCVMMAHL